MAIWQWSQTPAANTNADPTINWQEGQSPSSVNDSARVMMSVLAKQRDDTNGSLVTGGTASAYTIASNAGNIPNPPPSGTFLRARMNLSSNNNATLSVDGGTGYAIQSAPGVPVSAGTLVQGAPYGFTFSSTINAWLLNEYFAQPSLVPVGGIVIWPNRSSLPSNTWCWCNGIAVTVPAGSQVGPILGSPFWGGGAINVPYVITPPDLRELVPFGVAGMGGTGVRGISYSGTNNIGNYALIGAGGNSFIGEASDTPGLPSHAHTAHVNNAGLSGSAADHLHNVPEVIAIGGGVTIGLAQGNNVGPVTTGNADRTLTLSGSILDGNVTVDPNGSNSTHNTQPPSYPVGFILRIV